MDRMVSKTKFAKLAGVTKGRVTQLSKDWPQGATVGRTVNLDHPVVAQYLENRREKNTPVARTNANVPDRVVSPAAPAVNDPERGMDPLVIDEVRRIFPDVQHPDDVREIAGYTVEKIVDVFGAISGAEGYVKTMKSIADWRKVQLTISEKEGFLIPRELVKVSIFGAMEATNLRLLHDAPRTIASRASALIKAGAPVEDVEVMIREIISKHLKGVVKTARRVLKEG